MKVAFRTDASDVIGVGHVMRSLTLAEALRAQSRDISILFICRDQSGNLGATIRERKFDLALLPVTESRRDRDDRYWPGALTEEDARESAEAIAAHLGQPADWLIVDHYGLGMRWEDELRSASRRILAIDDLGRHHNCDMLLDQTFLVTAEQYASRVPAHCRILTGSNYALLRAEFVSPRQEIINARRASRPPYRLLISMGGSDPDNISLQVLAAVNAADIPWSQVTVVAGPSFIHTPLLQEYCADVPGYRVEIAPQKMSNLLLEHDIAIGASGGSSWERCAMGLPSAVLVIADNQGTIANNLASTGAVKVLGQPLVRGALETALEPWLSQREIYMRAVEAALDVCDGLGARRTVEAMIR